MTPPTVPRGACPSVAAPMPTGDGLLARLGGGPHWTPAAMMRLADAAAAHGNGRVEVTARGSVQVRGLRPGTVAAFAAAAEGLDGGATVAVGPLAGADPASVDPRGAAAAVAAGLGEVAPKLLVIVDGGGAIHLDALSADIRLEAEGGAWRVALAGDAAGATPLGMTDDPAEAARRALALLGRRRAREALAGGVAPFLGALAGLLRPAPPRPARPAAEAVGVHDLGGAVALGVAPAFGGTEAATLAALARAAEVAGATGLRPAPGRALVATGLRDAAPLRGAAAALGLVVDPADPRRRVAACAGAPGCASALLATRPLAAALAAGLAPGTGIAVHVSGCAKGCAHPGRAPITLVGGAGGIGLLRGGAARDVPGAWLPDAAAALDASLASLAPDVPAGHSGPPRGNPRP